MNADEIFTPARVCSSQFMESDLAHLTRQDIKNWYRLAQRIDGVINIALDRALEENPTCNRLTPELVAYCGRLLDEAGVERCYDLRNVEIFHGYRFYTKLDNGRMQVVTNNPDAFYGIAKATKYGIAHQHWKSDAFNLILEGEGLFTGDPTERTRFSKSYHGLPLVAGTELEIERGMTHGHLVKRGSAMWLFAYQRCGFAKGFACQDDFHPIAGYDLDSFGRDYD